MKNPTLPLSVSVGSLQPGKGCGFPCPRPFGARAAPCAPRAACGQALTWLSLDGLQTVKTIDFY